MLLEDLEPSQLLGPRLKIVNPPLWELGHLGWFQERWCLRYQKNSADLFPSLLPHADALYDSSTVAHATRWDLPLPNLDETLRYLRRVLDRVEDKLDTSKRDELAYFVQLASLHEEMHCEAFTYTRQTLGYRAPRASVTRPCETLSPLSEDADIQGGEFLLGALRSDDFVFDNEKWAHPVQIDSFAMARACVTNAAYAEFVEDRGYDRADLWCPAGWGWREAAQATHPVYWLKDGNTWYVRRYDVWQPLVPRAAVMHVNWYEADAYCRWAGRRLPSEAEWEYAASTTPADVLEKRHYPWGDAAPDLTRANLYGGEGDSADVAAYAAGDGAWGCRQLIGNVWEWTADTFEPYPGFVADPYKEYSQPWFGDHKVLRGGSHATRAHLIRNTWRNFYTPDRRDVIAGFRTCA